MNNKTVTIDSGPNKGGTWEPRDKDRKTIPVDGKRVEWVQGRKPEWMRDDYAEYALVTLEEPAILDDRAHRDYVLLETEQTNTHEYHDWKGYNNIVPVIRTNITINDVYLGSYTSRSIYSDMLHHLVGLHNYINKIRESLPVGQGWMTRQTLEELVGRQVAYKGMPGTITRVIPEQVCVCVHVPGYKDDYYDDETIKTTWTDKNLNWYV